MFGDSSHITPCCFADGGLAQARRPLGHVTQEGLSCCQAQIWKGKNGHKAVPDGAKHSVAQQWQAVGLGILHSKARQLAT